MSDLDRLCEELARVIEGPANDADVLKVLRALPALLAERTALREALRKISAIRDSIIGAQAVNWSEHIYPLVAALQKGGFEGLEYAEARKNVGTLLDRIAELERADAKWREIAADHVDLHHAHEALEIKHAQQAARIATLEARLAALTSPLVPAKFPINPTEEM
jgi:hypothetical protein